MTRSFEVTDGSLYVVEQLERHGYEAVFVGGAVRDYLLGKAATDIDIATSANPFEVKEVFEKTIDIGTEHGTIIVLIDHEPIEVTTYRTGEENDGDVVPSLREDLRRRDFTINALAMTKDQHLLDFFEGRKDLQKKMIRAVESPRERFEEDALRMLRAIRFASVLDFTIEKHTFTVMRQMAENLEEVAIERIKGEFDKLFASGKVGKAFNYLHESGLGEALPIFPKEWSKLEKLTPFSSSKEGWAMYMLFGQFSASEVSAAFKLSNDEKGFLTYVEKACMKRIEGPFTIDEIYFYDTEILAVVEKFHQAIHQAFCHQSKEISLDLFQREKNKLPIQSLNELAVSGQDLLKWANVRGGPWVGKWMKKIERAVVHGQCENNKRLIKEWFINDFNSEK